MPKFNKVNSDEFKQVQTSLFDDENKNELDVLSPFYFPPPEDQMNQKALAKLLGRTVQTICAWTEEGKIPYFRVGRFPIYSRKQIILYASKNQNLIGVK